MSVKMIENREWTQANHKCLNKNKNTTLIRIDSKLNFWKRRAREREKKEMPWLMIKNRFKTLIHTYAIYFTIWIFVSVIVFEPLKEDEKERYF